MEPIEIALTLELGALLIGVVGGVATWLHNRHVQSLKRQRERHHLEMRETQERHHRERLAVMRQQDKALEVIATEEKPATPRRGPGRARSGATK